MNAYKVGPFSADINPQAGTIIVFREAEKLMFYTADGATAKNAVKQTSQFFNIPVMPEYVSYSPFKVHFLPSGETRLEKAEGGVTFGRADFEDLISIIDMSVNACADILRLSGGARAGVRMPGPGEPAS